MATKTRKSEMLVASSERALAFIQALQKTFPTIATSAADRERLRKYLGKFQKDELRSVARRVMIDIMKRPARTIIGDSKYSAQPPVPSQSRQRDKTIPKKSGPRAKPTQRTARKRATGTAKSKAGRTRRKAAKP
jgi:hypothetical protein